MADSKSDSSSGASRPLGGPSKRPTATLELQATEIKVTAPAAGPSASAGKGTTTGDGTAKLAADDAKSSQAAAGKAASSVPGSDGKEKAAVGPSAKPAAAAAEAPMAKVPPPRSGGGGFLSHMAAAVVGGVLTLFGADYLASTMGVALPGSSGAQVALLSDRLNRLEAEAKERSTEKLDVEVRDRLKAFAAKIDAVSGVGATVGDLKAAQQKLAEQAATLEKQLSVVQTAPGQIDPAVATRIEKLEATLQTLASAASQPGDKIPQLAELTGRINDFESELDARLTALRKSLSDDIQKKASDLEDRLAQSSSAVAVETLKAGTTRLGRDLEAVKLSSDQLDQRIQAIQAAGEQTSKDIGALKANGEQLAKSIESVKSGLDTRLGAFVSADKLTAALAPLNDTIAKIQGDLGKVTQTEQNREQSAGRILLTLELANLKRAIERGEPFAAELAQVKRVAPKDVDLSALDGAADKGLPTTAALSGDFRGVTMAVLDTEASTPDANASFLDRLVTSARSVVRVRRTGAVEGDSTEAVIARMEVALKAGDLEGVVHEAKGLKGAARAAAEPWLSRISARLTVDQALASIEDALKKSLGDVQTN